VLISKRIFLAIFAPAILLAGGPEPGLSLHYEYYYDANQVSSTTPGFDARVAINPNWSVAVGAEVDGVTGASRVSQVNVNSRAGIQVTHAVPSFIDGLSGASAYEIRKSTDEHLHYDHDGKVMDIGYYNSSENDYFSSAPSLDLAYDLFNRNTTLSTSFSYFDDRFVQKSLTASNTDSTTVGSRKKNLISAQAGITQSLTKLTLVSGSVQSIHSWGYLSKPYNPILVPLAAPIPIAGSTDTQYYQSTYLPEVLPRTKVALVYAGEIVQGYNFIQDRLGSFRVSFRYYTDSWELKSRTIDGEWSQYLSESLYLRLRYRWYSQTGVSFAYSSYNGLEPYRTADIKYFPFTSQLFGFKFGGTFPDEWTQSWWVPARWNIKGDYTIRNTKGNPLLYEFYSPTQNYYQFTIMTGVDYVF